MDKLHHANVIVGDGGQSLVLEILERELSFKTQANPDFLLIESQSFGIDEVRIFGKWAIGKPLLGEVKASLIVAKHITREAQNALLKILEEPPKGTYIFINMESLGGLAETLISRVRVLKKSSVREDSIESKAFLKSDIKKKFSLIKKKDKEEIKEFIKELETVAYKGGEPYRKLKVIAAAKRFATARGASPKMLLEWLSCVL